MLGQQIRNQLNTFGTGAVDLGQVRVQLAGQKQAGIPSALVLLQITLSQQAVFSDGQIRIFEAEVGEQIVAVSGISQIHHQDSFSSKKNNYSLFVGEGNEPKK